MEKSKRNIGGNQYKLCVNRIYRMEAEIWDTFAGQLIDSIESNIILDGEQMLEDKLKKLNNIISKYEQLLLNIDNMSSVTE